MADGGVCALLYLPIEEVPHAVMLAARAQKRQVVVDHHEQLRLGRRALDEGEGPAFLLGEESSDDREATLDPVRLSRHVRSAEAKQRQASKTELDSVTDSSRPYEAGGASLDLGPVRIGKREGAALRWLDDRAAEGDALNTSLHADNGTVR